MHRVQETITMATLPQLTPTHYGAAAGAVTGLAIWALDTYVFHGTTPAEVSAAVSILLPGIVTGITGFLTRKEAKDPAPAPAPAPPK
jgi:ABC-type spermidine/putrescine transport system permease subunit II